MVVRRDAIEACTSARDDLVGDGVRRALADAIAGGMSPDQLRSLFESELARLSAAATKSNSDESNLESASSSNNEPSHE